MENENEKVISMLNDLIEICRDGQNGFRTAAADVDDVNLQILFSRYSAQRGGFATELEGLVLDLGGDPEKMGSVTGAAHRGWMNLKSAVTGNKASAIVAEAERGEDAAKLAYQGALKEILPPEVRTIIKRQYSSILDAHDTVRQLEIQAQS